MAEEKKEKKIGFFKKMYFSITKFEKYPEMAAEGTTSAFKYLIKLMLIFSVIVSLGLEYELHQTIKKSVEYIQNELPNISYSNGILIVESNEAIKIDSEIPSIDQVIIDTNTDSEEQIDKYLDSIPTDNTGILILKDKAIAKAVETNNRIEYKYEDVIGNISSFNKESITKQDIINYLSGSEAFTIYIMFFILMIIYVYILYLVSVLVDSLLISVLGNITVLFTKLKLKFSAVYNMSLYALTLSILLNAIYIVINSITGFEMNYFQIMYTSIAYVYLVAAIFMIRIDFEKKQEELLKIIEEQKKVKQEMNEKKEEQKEQEKNENKKPEEDNPESNDNDEPEQEPDGSEA